MLPLHYLLMKTHSRLNRWILAECAAIGLLPGQPKILECLLREGPCNQKQIAIRCEIEPATAGSILLRMERDGLICRMPPQDDRRARMVALTPHGREMAAQAEEIFRRADHLAAAGLDATEQARLQQALQAVYAALTEEAAE